MRFSGFVGPAYKLDSVNVDCQRCVNLYPEVIESGNGKEASTVYLRNTPGLELLFTVGSGPIRLILIDDPKKDSRNPANRIFVVSGSAVYKCSYDGSAWASVKIGDLGTTSGYVSASSLQGDLGSVVFVDSANTYLYWRYATGPSTATESFDTFSNFGYPAIPGATTVLWLDGFIIYIVGGTNQFYVSTWGTVFATPLSYASSEGDPDNLIGGLVLNRFLWLFNERSTEIWANTGNGDFPFERISGGFVEIGCYSVGSIAKIDGMAIWLGRDKYGGGQVYAAQSVNPTRISTHAVERAISTYANPQNSTAYTYNQNGHSYYVLNFDEATWVYDFSTKMWHERAHLNSGNLGRHRTNTHAYFTDYKMHLVGDYANGKVYALKEDVYTDNTDPIKRIRVAPHLSNSGVRIRYNSLQLDMETGIGLDGSGSGSDPQMIMRFSNDGGHTWSSEAWASAGKKIGGIGNFKARVRWNRLGMARDRVFEISTTDPVPIRIIGADLDLEAGDS